MDVIDNKHLKELYRKGSSKKLKLPKQVIKKFHMRVDAIMNANSIHDLWANPSLYFKKLQGDKNMYSMRLDRQYRLEMEVKWINEAQSIGKFYLKKVSNHYE